MTLTMADSLFSLSKMFDSSCSTVSCLLGGEAAMKRKPDLPTCLVRWPRRSGDQAGSVTRVLTFQVWLEVGQVLSSPGPGTSGLCSV